MSAPDHVPESPTDRARRYRSPDHVPDGWRPARESDLGANLPMGGLFGFQGPDQGYALQLAERFRDRLVLRDGEDADDVLAGAVLVATRRASLFGRAPVVHDLQLALEVFGFLRADPDADLVDRRRQWFEGLANPHHYHEALALVSLVPEATLRHAPGQLAVDWRDNLVPSA
jgi:hypothetical protein